MISKQRRAWAPASGAQEPSGHTGAVPDTSTRSPTRTARLKPMEASNGDPELTWFLSGMTPLPGPRRRAGSPTG